MHIGCHWHSIILLSDVIVWAFQFFLHERTSVPHLNIPCDPTWVNLAAYVRWYISMIRRCTYATRAQIPSHVLGVLPGEAVDDTYVIVQLIVMRAPMLFRMNYVNTMADDVLAPWVARPSAAMVLTVSDRQVLVFNETGLQLLMTFKCG